MMRPGAANLIGRIRYADKSAVELARSCSLRYTRGLLQQHLQCKGSWTCSSTPVSIACSLHESCMPRWHVTHPASKASASLLCAAVASACVAVDMLARTPPGRWYGASCFGPSSKATLPVGGSCQWRLLQRHLLRSHKGISRHERTHSTHSKASVTIAEVVHVCAVQLQLLALDSCNSHAMFIIIAPDCVRKEHEAHCACQALGRLAMAAIAAAVDSRHTYPGTCTFSSCAPICWTLTDCAYFIHGLYTQSLRQPRLKHHDCHDC
jgi:hypothetical protein